MDRYYTEDHEWIEVNGEHCIIGITGYAVKQLGDITFISLPESGASFRSRDVLCEIESVKAASDIYMPAGGTVTEVNEQLVSSPGDISSDPENTGWIAKIRIDDRNELEKLMNREQYQEYLKSLD